MSLFVPNETSFPVLRFKHGETLTTTSGSQLAMNEVTVKLRLLREREWFDNISDPTSLTAEWSHMSKRQTDKNSVHPKARFNAASDISNIQEKW